MIDRSLEWLALLTRYWSAAMAALDGIGITVALMLLAAILAGAGGMVNPKMRLYGALAGGMLMNALVKAMGGGFGAALAAMLVTTAVGYALGSMPLLLRALQARKIRV